MFTENFFYNNWLKNENEIEIANVEDILISYNLALENIEDLQYINRNKENLELINVNELTSLKDASNYTFLLIYFTDGKFKAYVKTSIANKEIDKSFNLKIFPKNELIFLLKILAKWVLPQPEGPKIFINLLDHLGQLSISLYASKLFSET